MGRLVYGNCHHEPLGSNTPLSDQLADLNVADRTRYFAAQSSARRIFVRRELPKWLDGWEIHTIRPVTSFAYLGSGGFRGPQLYPQTLYQLVKLADRILGLAPSLFAARLLVCISKKPSLGCSHACRRIRHSMLVLRACSSRLFNPAAS